MKKLIILLCLLVVCGCGKEEIAPKSGVIYFTDTVEDIDKSGMWILKGKGEVFEIEASEGSFTILEEKNCPVCGSQKRLTYTKFDGEVREDFINIDNEVIFYICGNCGNVYAGRKGITITASEEK